MKQLVIAATVLAMFLGTTAFAGGKTTTRSTGKSTTENVLYSGKKAKMHKKHHVKKAMKHDMPKADMPAKAAPAKKAPAKK